MPVWLCLPGAINKLLPRTIATATASHLAARRVEEAHGALRVRCADEVEGGRHHDEATAVVDAHEEVGEDEGEDRHELHQDVEGRA